jgi:hypothetical protein
LLLFGACGDGGTVDPNAFAEGFSSADDLPQVTVTSSSSEGEKNSYSLPAVNVSESSSSRSAGNMPTEMSKTREDKGYSSSESINPTLDSVASVDVYVHKYFNFNANNANNYIVSPKNGVDSTYVVNASVYEEEKGAVSYCADDDKSYTLRFRILAEKDVKKLLNLKGLGAVCEDISKKFKDAGESKSGAELQTISACDSNGNLELFCSYTDTSANFVTLLADFINEVETNGNSEYLNASVYLQNQW